MKGLLDANVLIALAWPTHESHLKVRQWFHRNARHGWVTCPFTEAAFVRILSNPAFSPNAVTPMEAMRVLVANLGHPQHEFWPADLTLQEALSSFESKLGGHQQISDAYLLALAIHKGGRLVTLDKAVASLLGPDAADNSVEIIS